VASNSSHSIHRVIDNMVGPKIHHHNKCPSMESKEINWLTLVAQWSEWIHQQHTPPLPSGDNRRRTIEHPASIPQQPHPKQMVRGERIYIYSSSLSINIMMYCVIWCIGIIVSGRNAGRHCIAVTVKTIDETK
jgi:hypothetical protein